jgi:DNA-binding NarL/FixJ family response regulator
MSSPLSFLVVEDEEGVRRVLVRSLSRFGKTEAVGTFASARLALRVRKYDALIVDVKLPDGDGLALIEVARKRSPNISVLVVTGSTEHGVISRTLAGGARYILKPCNTSHLAVVVEEVKQRKNARERRTQLILTRWKKDYDLTDTEVELLALGAEGVPRQRFPRRRGVRKDTIRMQIKMLLQKTGDDTFEGAVNSLLREAVAEPT